MKIKWTILFLIALILFLVFAVILPQTRPDQEEQRLVRLTAEARKSENATLLTQAALDPTMTPATSLESACGASKSPVVLTGTLSFSIIVSSLGSGKFTAGSVNLQVGDETASLEGVPVCRFDKGIRENCVSFPPKDFKSSDLTGFDANGERFRFGDRVTVHGSTQLEGDQCLIKFGKIVNEVE